MGWQERIVSDPKVLVGKPTIRGTRIAVDFVIELLGEGCSEEDVVANYPHLTKDDVQAAIQYNAQRGQQH